MTLMSLPASSVVLRTESRALYCSLVLSCLSSKVRTQITAFPDVLRNLSLIFALTTSECSLSFGS